MTAVFRLSVTFLDPVPAFHGRADGGEPEWPPSPLRAFAALVAAAAARWREPQFGAYAVPTLEWLERLGAPTVVAPGGHVGPPVRTAVPNNDLDKWAKDLARRRPPDKQPSELKTLKTVRPTRLVGGDTVHYLWPLPAGAGDHPAKLAEMARGVTHLGWGIDLAAGSAGVLPADEADRLPGERWTPAGAGTARLRVPNAGTLAGLRAKHDAFVGRLSAAGFAPVPPLTAFDVVGYRNAAEPAGRPWAAFELQNPDPEVGGRVAFDPARSTRDVAAMLRHAAADACRGWPFGDTERFVCGHDGPGMARSDDRFQYLPLPTVERRPTGEVVGSIRRVLVTAPPGCEEQVDWLRRRLPGRPLERLPAEVRRADERVAAVLGPLPADDWVLRQYTRSSADWSSVTPVLLPGHDDRDRGKATGLVWKAFRDAGLSAEALAGATAEWRAVGFRAGVELARRYQPAEELDRWPRYHVRVQFARPVAGPLAVGAGRYRGFGLLAAG